MLGNTNVEGTRSSALSSLVRLHMVITKIAIETNQGIQITASQIEDHPLIFNPGQS